MKKIIFMTMLCLTLLYPAELETNKDVYDVNENIELVLTELRAESNDWVAIFPAESNNDFGAIVQWQLTGGTVDAALQFNPLREGSYDVRLFYGAEVVEGVSKRITVVNDENAVTNIQTNKEIYKVNEAILVNYENMSGNDQDWIGIYPKNSNNDWENVLQWTWTDGGVVGNHNFEGLAVGEYEVRAFFNNSFNMEAHYAFSVEGDNPVTTVKTNKDVYAPNEEVIASFENMSGDNEDWMGIYPAGSENTWENMVDWKWIAGDIEGERRFNGLAAGEYEVRVFFENSFEVEASYAFVIEDDAFEFSLRKNPLDPYELIRVDFENMPGLDSDWIGIFEIGAEDAKETAIAFKDTNNQEDGELTFNGLRAGEYEARAYFQGKRQGLIQFTVQDKAIERVLYDDFEDGIDPRWTKYFGRDMTLLNVGAIDQAVGHTQRQVQVAGQHSLRTYNSDGLAQSSGYFFDFESPNKKFKFLNVDMKIGVSSHRFAFGVKVKTKFGDRRIEFASWLNHTLPSGQQIIRGPYGNVLEGHRQAFTQDNYLFVHPGPSDYYVGTSGIGRGSTMFINYKINIEEKLRLMEPDNELYEITLFSTSGGDYDNLALTTH
jgi:hypothetical protein